MHDEHTRMRSPRFADFHKRSANLDYNFWTTLGNNIDQLARYDDDLLRRTFDETSSAFVRHTAASMVALSASFATLILPRSLPLTCTHQFDFILHQGGLIYLWPWRINDATQIYRIA